MDFMKGGRGIKAPYKTVTKRIPEPVAEQLDKLVDEYRASLAGGESSNSSEDDISIVDELKLIIDSIENNKPGYKPKSATRLIKKLLELKEQL